MAVLKDSGDGMPWMAVEDPGYKVSWLTETVSSDSGQRFMYYPDKGKWYDLKDSGYNNLRIKAFTVDREPDPDEENTESGNGTSENGTSGNGASGNGTESGNGASENGTESGNQSGNEVPESNIYNYSDTSPVVVKGRYDISGRFTISANKYRFVSSDKKVASVNKKGILKAKRPGSVTVTLQEKSGKKWTDVSSNVIEVIQPALLTKTLTLSSGTQSYDLSRMLSGTSYLPTQWVSTKTGVVTVDSTGEAAVHGTGSSKVYAVYGGSMSGLNTTGKKYSLKIKIS